MKEKERYWTYKAPPVPEFSDLPPGTFAGNEQGFNSLSPGMRREIYKNSMKKIEKAA